MQDVSHDGSKSIVDRVQIDLEQVYRAKDQLYIRYSITNQTKEPFRLTTPDVSAPLPDPGPDLTVDQVRDLLTPAYPEIATASVTGPEDTGSALRYTFSRAIGTKG